jgi:DNA polymerase
MEYAKNTYGIDLDYAAAERIVKLYRQTHPMIVLFWKKLGRAFRLATQNTSQAYVLPHGLRFSREENATVIQLPSTRKLYYTGATVEGTARYSQLMMPNPAAKYGGSIPMWGGYLAENIVQAVSRDILAETVLKIEELGVRIPLIVHDDMSIVVPENEAEAYRSQIEDIARIPPTWASGLPIDVESRISKEYNK